MAAKKIMMLALLSLFLLNAGALYCGKGDRGGLALEFTVRCFGKGEIAIDCSNGSSRPQCFERKSCDVSCMVGETAEYLKGCRANCGADVTTYTGITCKPLPLSNPTINLPFDEYQGYVKKSFAIEGFAADYQFIKDIYFQPVEGCDLNQVKSDLGTERASVKATFDCNLAFAGKEIVLVAKDECNATATSTALLSTGKYCGKECVSRLYPQCRDSTLLECVQDGNCTELHERECEHGCKDNACCIPQLCQELGFECGDAINNCDENVSCGSCANGALCSGNKCAAQEAGDEEEQILTLSELQQKFYIFGFDPLLIAAAIALVFAALLVFFKLRKQTA